MGDQRFTPWEARYEIVRGAIRYLERADRWTSQDFERYARDRVRGVRPRGTQQRSSEPAAPAI
jgi:hypothetical protein